MDEFASVLATFENNSFSSPLADASGPGEKRPHDVHDHRHTTYHADDEDEISYSCQPSEARPGGIDENKEESSNKRRRLVLETIEINKGQKSSTHSEETPLEETDNISPTSVRFLFDIERAAPSVPLVETKRVIENNTANVDVQEQHETTTTFTTMNREWTPYCLEQGELTRAVCCKGFPTNSSYDEVESFFRPHNISDIARISFEDDQDDCVFAMVVFASVESQHSALALGQHSQWQEHTISIIRAKSPRLDRGILVRGLPPGCTAQQVRDLFGSYELGEDIESVELPLWQDSWGEVVFKTLQVKQESLGLHGIYFEGSSLDIIPSIRSNFCSNEFELRAHFDDVTKIASTEDTLDTSVEQVFSTEAACFDGTSENPNLVERDTPEEQNLHREDAPVQDETGLSSESKNTLPEESRRALVPQERVCSSKAGIETVKHSCREGSFTREVEDRNDRALSSKSSTIVLFDVPRYVTTGDVRSVLERFGPISYDGGIRFVRSRNGSRRCFVDFDLPNHAKEAVGSGRYISLLGVKCGIDFDRKKGFHAQCHQRTEGKVVTEQDSMETRIVIFDLDPSTTIVQVEAALKGSGRIMEGGIRITSKNGFSKCFVDFERSESAQRVVEHEKRVVISGKSYSVGYDRQSERRRETPSSTVVIVGLASEIKVEHVKAILANFGRILHDGVRIVAKPNGIICFVDFENIESAIRVVEQEKQVHILGRPYAVGYDGGRRTYRRTSTTKTEESCRRLQNHSMHHPSVTGPFCFPEAMVSNKVVGKSVDEFGSMERSKAGGLNVEYDPTTAIQGDQEKGGFGIHGSSLKNAPNSAIVVYGLAPTVTEQDVALAMCQFGRILPDGIRLKPRGNGLQLAFVDFDCIESARKVVELDPPIGVMGHRPSAVDFVRRKPPTDSIGIFGVPREASRDDIRAALQHFGRIREPDGIRLQLYDKVGNAIWMVSFEDIASSRAAVEGSHGHIVILGRECRVDFSKVGGDPSGNSFAYHTSNARENRTTDYESRDAGTSVALFGVSPQARGDDIRTALWRFGPIRERDGVRSITTGAGNTFWIIAFEHSSSAKALLDETRRPIILGHECRADYLRKDRIGRVGK